MKSNSENGNQSDGGQNGKQTAPEKNSDFLIVGIRSSAAEELEAGREELQSVNEKLLTVNQELEIKIKELAQSNNDFQNLISSSDVGTLFLDRSLRVKMFTPRVLDVFNLIQSDIGRSLPDIAGKIVIGDFVRDVEGVFTELQPVEREIKTSEGRWYLMDVTPYRTSDDCINGVVITFLEITRRKQQEEELRKLYQQIERQSQAFDATFSTITDFVYIFDRDGRFLYANQLLLDLWGLKAEDAIGKTLAEVGYDKDVEAKLLADIRQVYDTKQSLRGETPYTNPKGISGYFEYIFNPQFAADGTVEIISGSTRDISERREMEERLRSSEERLRLLIESAKDYAIITTTPDVLIDSWNKGAERIFGWSEAEVIGKSNEILFTPEDRAAGVPEKETETTLEKGFAEDERWHIRKDGSRFYVSGVMWQLLDPEGKLIGFVKIARDMTEKIQADEKLRRAHEYLEIKVAERTSELAASNESLQNEIVERRQIEQNRLTLLRKLVTTQEDERQRISRELHDHLGQQLTALRLNLESLRENCREYADLYDKITQTQKIAAQLDADVDFLAWELRPAALEDLGLRSALENYVKEWSLHFGIPSEFHTAGLDDIKLTPEVEINLYRIMQEALNNTSKYAEAKQASVLFERHDGHITLIIEDDGAGFDIKEATTFEKGKGLGLIGMRERATLIGGTLEIESGSGQGTTIFVRLPL